MQPLLIRCRCVDSASPASPPWLGSESPPASAHNESNESDEATRERTTVGCRAAVLCCAVCGSCQLRAAAMGWRGVRSHLFSTHRSCDVTEGETTAAEIGKLARTSRRPLRSSIAATRERASRRAWTQQHVRRVELGSGDGEAVGSSNSGGGVSQWQHYAVVASSTVPSGCVRVVWSVYCVLSQLLSVAVPERNRTEQN